MDLIFPLLQFQLKDVDVFADDLLFLRISFLLFLKELEFSLGVLQCCLEVINLLIKPSDLFFVL